MVAQMEKEIRQLKQTPEESSAEILRNAQESVENTQEVCDKIHSVIS